MVYFMQPVEGGPIKIGHSNQVEVRRNALQVRYGRKLVVLKVIEGGVARESEIHAMFAEYRIGETEQFHPGPNLMEFLGINPLFRNGLDEDFRVEPLIPVKRTIPIHILEDDYEWLWIAAAKAKMTKSKFAETAVIRAIRDYRDSLPGDENQDDSADDDLFVLKSE